MTEPEKRRRMDAHTSMREVQRILGDEAAMAQDTFTEMPIPVRIVIDPDALAIVFVFPNLPLSSTHIAKLFWDMANVRGWGTPNDGQRAIIVIVPLMEDGDETPDDCAEVAAYVEISRPDTEYGGPGSTGFVGSI